MRWSNCHTCDIPSEALMATIDDTLKDRGKRYGTFALQARLTEKLLDVMIMTRGWGELQADQREALRMIATKISRMLNGDPDYDDNWRDIAGFATLVLNRLEKDAGK